MNQQQRLTKQQIAQKTGISIGRVKYAMSQFSEYFPARKIDGYAYSVYDPESIEIVKTITDMIQIHDHTAIRLKLNDEGYDVVIEDFRGK